MTFVFLFGAVAISTGYRRSNACRTQAAARASLHLNDFARPKKTVAL
jgi:hypothetical protein